MCGSNCPAVCEPRLCQGAECERQGRVNARIQRAAGQGMPASAPPDSDDGEEQAAVVPNFDGGARMTACAPQTVGQRNRLIRAQLGRGDRLS